MSIIVSVGEKVPELAAKNMVILFSEKAPQDLKEYCVVHNSEQKIVDFTPGYVILGDSQYEIKEIGSAAIQNFNDIGHLTLQFNKDSQDIQPGSVSISEPLHAIPKQGDIIKFEAR
ncbi:MAG: PTS glucitol/sorbitol transporter subunit IIA [Defluviitaleaceae bacterium]|nr:PTS glucitol/sorbitol transporter subunit IIA [Defluviitaleaceae bacterium]